MPCTIAGLGEPQREQTKTANTAKCDLQYKNLKIELIQIQIQIQIQRYSKQRTWPVERAVSVIHVIFETAPIELLFGGLVALRFKI